MTDKNQSVASRTCKWCEHSSMDLDHAIDGTLLQCRRDPPVIVSGAVQTTYRLLCEERGVTDRSPRGQFWECLHDAVREATKWPAVGSGDVCSKWTPNYFARKEMQGGAEE